MSCEGGGREGGREGRREREKERGEAIRNRLRKGSREKSIKSNRGKPTPRIASISASVIGRPSLLAVAAGAAGEAEGLEGGRSEASTTIQPSSSVSGGLSGKIEKKMGEW